MTPVDHELPSPAELLFGRPIQDNLARKILRIPASEEVTFTLTERQQLQKYYYDQSTKQLPALIPGQRVTIQDPVTLKWKPAEIRKKLNGAPCSYVITTPTGGELRLNRAHIQEAHQDRALGPDPNEQWSTYDASSLSPSITEPFNPDPPSSQAITLSASYTTRSGRVVNPPQMLDF